MLLHRLLKKRVKVGQLTVTGADGSAETYGDGSGAPLSIRLTRRAERWIALDPHLGLGEAYMEGDLVFDRGDVEDLMILISRNIPADERFHRNLLDRLWIALATACGRGTTAVAPSAMSPITMTSGSTSIGATWMKTCNHHLRRHFARAKPQPTAAQSLKAHLAASCGSKEASAARHRLRLGRSCPHHLPRDHHVDVLQESPCRANSSPLLGARRPPACRISTRFALARASTEAEQALAASVDPVRCSAVRPAQLPHLFRDARRARLAEPASPWFLDRSAGPPDWRPAASSANTSWAAISQLFPGTCRRRSREAINGLPTSKYLRLCTMPDSSPLA